MNRMQRNKVFQAALAKKRDREDHENRSKQLPVDAPSSPIVATKRNATSQLSKLFLQRHSPSGCVGAALLSNVHRLHLNAEIHGLCGRPLSLHAFAPKMKADSVLDVSTSTTRCLKRAVVTPRHKPLVSTPGQKLHRKNVGYMAVKHSNALLIR